MSLEITVGEVMNLIATLRLSRKVIDKHLTGSVPISDAPLFSPQADAHFIKIEEILRNLQIHSHDPF